MKKIFATILSVGMLLSLAACSFTREPNQEPGPSHAATQPTDDSTQATASQVLYTRHVWRADFPVQTSPGYDYAPTATIGAVGDYNIIAEQFDDEDNLWGKLESGEGWIDLTLLQAEEITRPALTVGYASQQTLTEPYYCEADDSKYAVGIAIHAHEILTDVSMFPLEMQETYQEGEAFFEIPAWVPGRALVAQLAFPGDLSAYGIRFTDSQGQIHTYTITESGRNGAVFMHESID